MIDSLVPGLWAVVQAHGPLVRCWPFQLSTQGFTNSFFNNVQLPGDRGKGTPWSAVAGRFEVGTRQLLAGLVCVADRPNSLSQMTVAHVGQWLDVCGFEPNAFSPGFRAFSPLPVARLGAAPINPNGKPWALAGPGCPRLARGSLTFAATTGRLPFLFSPPGSGG